MWKLLFTVIWEYFIQWVVLLKVTAKPAQANYKWSVLDLCKDLTEPLSIRPKLERLHSKEYIYMCVYAKIEWFDADVDLPICVQQT